MTLWLTCLSCYIIYWIWIFLFIRINLMVILLSSSFCKFFVVSYSTTGRLMKNITRLFALDKKSGAIVGFIPNANFSNEKTWDNVFLLLEKAYKNFIIFLCLVYCLLFLISHTISLTLFCPKFFYYNFCCSLLPF